MTNVPTLSPDDLSAELELIHRKEHRSFNTLVLARMNPLLAEVEVKTHRGRVRFHVEAARSEIELRAALPDGPDDPPAVVLVDWDPGRLPADLHGRVANGMVYTIARGRRLRACFSHAQLASEVEQCRPLVDALLHEPGFHRQAPPGGLVTLDVAWRAWLVARKVFGDESEREGTVLLRFTREAPPHGLGAHLAQRPELHAELDAWLRHAVGPVAPWALRLWLEGKGGVAGALAFVLDGARDSLGAQDFVAGMLSARLSELSKPLADTARTDAKLLGAWADLANILAAQCEDAPERLTRLLDAADGFLPAHDAIDAALSRSDYLRVAVERRKRTLADALQTVADAPGEASLTPVIAALDALGRHKLREVDAGERTLHERARMAARLLGWLSLRARDVAFSATESDVTVLTEHAEAFVRHGSFADLARRVARGRAEAPLGAAIQRIVEMADAQRDRDDAEFAAKLVRWNELGRPMDRVIPVEMALDVFGASFLRGRARRKTEEPETERRLLVLVLEGASWDRVVELLEALEASRYAPLRWNPGSDGGRIPPVLAALPTITDVSRAALLAGQLLRPGDPLDATRDALRLLNHKALRALGVKAPLLVRSTLLTPAGDLAPDLLEHVGIAERVVAVALTGADFMSDSLRAMRELFERATLSNRAVLLASDHGRASSARMERALRRREDEVGGTRWRTCRSDASPRQGEVVVSGSYVWRPQGVERVSLITSETDAYEVASREGEQGGATLSEVVTPVILIGAESLAERMRTAFDRETVDAETEVRPLERPTWWSLRVEGNVAPPRTPTPASKPAPRREPVSAQPALPSLAVDLRPALPVAAPTAPKTSAWAAFFTASKTLKQIGRRMDPRFVAAVEALDAEGGTMSFDRLAAALDLMPMRVGGLVSSMAEVLNADGTQVIQSDSATRMVRLDVAALKEIFG